MTDNPSLDEALRMMRTNLHAALQCAAWIAEHHSPDVVDFYEAGEGSVLLAFGKPHHKYGGMVKKLLAREAKKEGVTVL